MKRFFALSLITLSGFTVSCSWPMHGYGGMDDAFVYSRQHATHWTGFTPRPWFWHAPNHWNALAKRVDRARLAIDVLNNSGAGLVAPAKLELVDRHWALAAREYAGGFYEDCRARLDEIDIMLDGLRAVLAAHQQGEAS